MKIEFFKIAKNPYSDYQKSIEEISRENAFKDWFPESERDYFYLEADDIDGDDIKVIDFLKNKGYEVTDYKKGFARRFNSKREIKIGKLLNNIEKNALKSLQKMKSSGKISSLKIPEKNLRRKISDIREKFEQSYFRNSGKDFVVVISNNRHDIAKMSTDRNWTSCMSLDDGLHRRDIYCEVENGGFVAYLTRAGDNYIEDPLSRIRIRRFSNNEGVNLAIPEESVYGLDLPAFRKAVSRWIQERQPHVPIGIYQLGGGVQSDSFKKDYFYFPDNLKTKELIDLFLTKENDERFVLKYFEIFYNGSIPNVFFDIDNNMLIQQLVESVDGLKYDDLEKAKKYANEYNHDIFDFVEKAIKSGAGEDLPYGTIDEIEDYLAYEPSFFEVLKEKHSLVEAIQQKAAIKLSKKPRGVVPLDIIEDIISHPVDFYMRVDILSNIQDRYPEMITAEDVSYYGLDYKKLTKKSAKELRDSAINDIKETRILTENNELNNGASLLSIRLLKAIGILKELGYAIPEPTVIDLVYIFSHKDFRESFFNSGLTLLGLFVELKMDTPAVQKFIHSLLPLFQSTSFSCNKNRMILKAIHMLGANGHLFLGWIQQELEKMEKDIDVDDLFPTLKESSFASFYESMKAIEFEIINPQEESPYEFVL